MVTVQMTKNKALRRSKETILIVEDDNFFATLLAKKLLTETSFQVAMAADLAQADALLKEEGGGYFAAIVDYNLPDGPRGEAIDLVTSHQLPVIVFTGTMSEDVRDFVWSKKVVDYVLKEDPQSLDYVVSLLRRLEKNLTTKILVVDDSIFFRKVLSNLLEIHTYQVLSAGNGEEALQILEAHPDIKLVMTDFDMPVMDGIELTQKIRLTRKKNELAIIGISAEGQQMMAARFMKFGANDFMIKQSFLPEEFYCRVADCLYMIEQIELIREASIKDFLTGLYNRRYFFEMGRKYFANAERDNLSVVCAMLDIDYFKKVNDTFGHDAGDIVLQHISSLLQERMRDTDIVARLGGEEFAVLAVNMSAKDAVSIFEIFRQTIAATTVDIGGGQQVQVTISIGVSTAKAESLQGLIKLADELLYEAKETGRNRVTVR